MSTKVKTGSSPLPDSTLLAALPPPTNEHLALADLDSSSTTHVRVEISKETVADYTDLLKEGREFPPITVFRSAGKLYLADGFHRVAAHLAAGRTHVEAHVYAGTAQNALWFELGANATHGRRLTRAETRRALKLALDRCPDASSKDIADHVGCGSALVAKVRKERQRDADGPPDSSDRPAPVADAEPGGGSPERVQNENASGEPASVSGGHSRTEYDDSNETIDPADDEPPTQRSHDQSNRILSDLAQDAATFADQLHLVDFRTVDPAELPGWIANLKKGRREIEKLIQRLAKVTPAV